ncbi:MAG: phage tail tape measure protein, partial [Chloroflexi bacterium]|nr:phage tail tape measure protein [Chloroflexota bacterium]
MASRELNLLIKAKNLASGAIASVKKELGGLNKDLGRIGSKAGHNLARNFERGVIAAGAGIAAGATFAITTAASFEQAEAGIRKTVGGSIAQVDALIASVKNMSREVPLSFEELAAIAAEGGALGIATESLDEFTEIIARLGVSTDLTTDEAASAFGQLANVLGMSDADMQSFADSLVALGNDGASTESQILDMTARFGAAGRAAGLTNEQILALASTTASMGVEAEAGGGALSRLFNNMTQDIALSSKQAEVLGETLGLSMEDLREAWDKDAAGVFEDLLGHLNELDKFDQAKLLSDLGITNTRDLNAIMLLSAGVEEYQKQLGVAEGATGALDKESDAFFNTTQGKWETLKNNVRLAADMVGRELLPVVNDLMTEFVDWLSLDTTQSDIKQFAKDIAENAKEFAGWLKDLDWGAIGNALSTAAGAAKALLDAFLSMPGWVQQVLAGGFVANKLTGGAVGDLIGLVGKGVIKGVMNMNAGVVNVNAATVNGVPGGVGGAGGKAGVGRLLGGALAVGGGIVAGAHIGTFLNEEVGGVKEARSAALEGISAVLDSGDAGRIEHAIGVVKDALNPDDFAQAVALGLDVNGVRTTLEEQLAALEAA